MSVNVVESDNTAVVSSSVSTVPPSQSTALLTSDKPEGIRLSNLPDADKACSAKAVDPVTKIDTSTSASSTLPARTSPPTLAKSIEPIESPLSCLPIEENKNSGSVHRERTIGEIPAEPSLAAEQKATGDPLSTAPNESGHLTAGPVGAAAPSGVIEGTPCSEVDVGTEIQSANVVTSEPATAESHLSTPIIAHPHPIAHPLGPEGASSAGSAEYRQSAVPNFSGHVTSRIGKRYHATADQLSALTVAFEANPSPSADTLLELSKKTLMPLQNLVLWFKNRRARSTRIPAPVPLVELSQSGRRSYVKSGIYSKKPKSTGQPTVNPGSEHVCSASISAAAQTTGILTARLTTLTSGTPAGGQMSDVNENVDTNAERLNIGGSSGRATIVGADDHLNDQSHHHHDDHSHDDEHHHTLHLHDHGDHTHHLHPHIPPHQHQDDHHHLDHEDGATEQVDGGSTLVEADVLDSCGLPTSMPASVFPATDEDSTTPGVAPAGVHLIIGSTRRIDAQDSQGPTETCKRRRVANMEVIGDANPCAAWDSETCHARFATFLSMSTNGRSNEQVDCALAIASKFFFDEMQNGLTLTSAVQILSQSRHVLEQLMESTLCKSGAKLNSGLSTTLHLFLEQIRSGRAADSCATFRP
jgi:Homeodomain